MDPEQIGSWGWEDWSNAISDVMNKGVRSMVYGPVKQYFRETLGEAGQGISDDQMLELMGTQADQAGRPGAEGWNKYGSPASEGTAVPMVQEAGIGRAPFKWGDFLNKPPFK